MKKIVIPQEFRDAVNDHHAFGLQVLTHYRHQGHCEGIFPLTHFGEPLIFKTEEGWEEYCWGQSTAALCSKIRDGIEEMGHHWELAPGAISIDLDCSGDEPHEFGYQPASSELGYHIAAAMFVWERQQAKKRDQLTAAEWNAKYPIGTRVRYWPFEREGEGRESCTRSEAWELGSGHPVVKVNGYRGGIHLTHVEPIAEEGEGE